MIIRKEQIEAFEEARLPEFEDYMVAHLRQFTPLHSKSIGETGIRTLISAGMERARRYGFTRMGPVRFYIETTVLFGIDFDTDPQYAWFEPLLNEPAVLDQTERADRVHDAVTGFLAAVAGEDREYAIRSLRRARGQAFEFAPVSSPGFADLLISRAGEMYPEKADRVGRAALERLIARAAEEAGKWNSGTDAGVCLFFGMMFAIGHGFVHDPKYPWVPNTLGHSGYTPEKRVERLYSKAMIYLDNVLGHLERP